MNENIPEAHGLIGYWNRLPTGYYKSFYSSWPGLARFGFARTTGMADDDSAKAKPILVPFTMLLIPDWFFALIFSVIPAVWLMGALQVRRRIKSGRCPICGYDLRATPDRCPECGGGVSPANEPDAQ
ncbi:MAG TPA: hypothetical protein VHD56_06290 [Tepidisphaeraceae bacterium]|nr:hypothetical protein [Tepidisphaeraceae bacterium]